MFTHERGYQAQAIYCRKDAATCRTSIPAGLRLTFAARARAVMSMSHGVSQRSPAERGGLQQRSAQLDLARPDCAEHGARSCDAQRHDRWARPEDVDARALHRDARDLDRALEGVDLEKTSLFVRSGASALPFAALLLGWQRAGKSATQLRGCIEMTAGCWRTKAGCHNRSPAHTGKWRRSPAGRRRMRQAANGCVHSRAWHDPRQRRAGAGVHAGDRRRISRQLDKEAWRRYGSAAHRLPSRWNELFHGDRKLRALRCSGHARGSGGRRDAARKISLHVRTRAGQDSGRSLQ